MPGGAEAPLDAALPPAGFYWPALKLGAAPLAHMLTATHSAGWVPAASLSVPAAAAASEPLQGGADSAQPRKARAGPRPRSAAASRCGARSRRPKRTFRGQLYISA
jgi:hypothetical protein